MFSKTVRQIATGVVAAALSVPVVAAVASADTTDNSTMAAPSGEAGMPGGGAHDERRHSGELRGMLDNAVAGGIITAEQADAIVRLAGTHRQGRGAGAEGHDARADGQDADRRGGTGGRPERWRGGRQVVSALAAVTGRSVDDIRAELAGGATPADVAGDNFDALVARLTDVAEAHLASGVAEGRITQPQADEKLAALASDLPVRLAAAHTAADGPRDGGQGRRRGGNHGAPGGASARDLSTGSPRG